MSILDISKKYFSPDILSKDVGTKILAGAQILSYFTVVVPLIFVLIYAAASCCLRGRVKEKLKSDPTDEKVISEANKKGLRDELLDMKDTLTHAPDKQENNNEKAINKVQAEKSSIFKTYTFKYEIDNKKHFAEIQNSEDEKKIIDTLLKHVNDKHTSINISHFPYPEKIDCDNPELPKAYTKNFEINEKRYTDYRNASPTTCSFVLQPKTKISGFNKKILKVEYHSGVVEELTKQDEGYVGVRRFPDGTLEKGEFVHNTIRNGIKLFTKGYRLQNGKYTFINPLLLGKMTNNEVTNLFLAEINDDTRTALFMVENISEKEYTIVQIKDQEVIVDRLCLLHVIQNNDNESTVLENIFKNKHHTILAKDFIEFLFNNTDKDSNPRIFSVASKHVNAIIDIAKKDNIKFDFHIKDKSGQSLFSFWITRGILPEDLIEKIILSDITVLMQKATDGKTSLAEAQPHLKEILLRNNMK